MPEATENAQSYRQIKASRRAQQNFIHRAKRLLMQNVCCRSGTVFFFASRFTSPLETLKFISHSVLFKCRSDKRRLYSCCSVICTILTCPRTWKWIFRFDGEKTGAKNVPEPLKVRRESNACVQFRLSRVQFWEISLAEAWWVRGCTTERLNELNTLDCEILEDKKANLWSSSDFLMQ